MTTRKPPTYQEIAVVLDRLPIVVQERRRALGISIRSAAKQIGISHSTLVRLEKGEDTYSRALMPVLRWVEDSYKQGK